VRRPFRLRRRPSPGGGAESTIVVEGEFDLSGVERFQACVSEALAGRPGSITVDARGLTFIDSCGLQAWLRARDAAAQSGVGFRVRDPSPEVRRIAELAGIENLLNDD
jgi:anti-sigma B factor antagonist